jgi:hypothetical protein
MMSFLIDLKTYSTEEEIYILLEQYDIIKLDVDRIYRYINRITGKNEDIQEV